MAVTAAAAALGVNKRDGWRGGGWRGWRWSIAVTTALPAVRCRARIADGPNSRVLGDPSGSAGHPAVASVSGARTLIGASVFAWSRRP